MLNVKKEKFPKSKVKLTVTLPKEVMVDYFTKVYEKMASNVNIKGFRPGKAPKHLTIMEIGESRINSEIIDMALSDSYGKVLKQEDLVPVGPPKVEIKKMVDLTTDEAVLEYEAEVDVLPEVKLGDYKKIKIKKSEDSKLKITKDELDQVYSHLQRQHAQFKDIERPAKEGDRVEMDFEGTERGVILENLTSKNYPVVLGSKVLIPEFEKEVEGMKVGDEKEFDVEVGKDKGKKKVHFKVKMNLVQDVILPELNDELAAKFSQKSLEDLKKVVEADVMDQKKLAQKQNKENEVIEQLLKITEIEVPESLVEQESQRMIDQLRSRTESMGLPFDKYLESMGKNEEELVKSMAEQATKTVKVGLTLGEIGKQEKIDLSKEDSGAKVIEKLVEYATK